MNDDKQERERLQRRDRRQNLLCRIAGNVVPGIIRHHPSASSAEIARSAAMLASHIEAAVIAMLEDERRREP